MAVGVDTGGQHVNVDPRPPSRTFIVNASAARNVQGRRRLGRAEVLDVGVELACHTETCDFDSRVMPRVSTSFSIRPVETPSG